MNRYQFEKIQTRAIRKYGKMKREDLSFYSMQMYVIESNILKTVRQDPEIKDRDVRDAIFLVLHEIANRLKEEEETAEEFVNEKNSSLKHAILFAFDPFSNAEIEEIHPEVMDDLNELNAYYKFPVVCLLRILDSVDFWSTNMGGYLKRIESEFGEKVTESELKYAVFTKIR